jgi:predicted glycogen debranching enzyme
LVVLDTLVKDYNSRNECFSLDIPLLLVRAIQFYTDITGETKNIVHEYKETAKIFFDQMFESHCGIEIRDNGLIYIKPTDLPTSWMNESENGKAIVPRYGYLPEINALWYNALMFVSKIAKKYRISSFQERIGNIPEKIEKNYTQIFWNPEENNLYDFVTDTEQNSEVRPNQIFSIGLPYSPVEKEKRSAILDKVKRHLLTERGLRTLSPKSQKFIGVYTGNEAERRAAVHQGTVHPWLIGVYCDAVLNVYGEEEVGTIEKIYCKFEQTMYEEGLGTVSELYDGNPPHKGKGAVSFAPSVAELLRIKHRIDTIKNKNL